MKDENIILRNKNAYQTFSSDFLKFDILVVCPKCSRKAIVKPDNFSFKNIEESTVKVICTNCGYNKLLTEKPTSVLYSTGRKILTGRYYVLSGEIDPFFYLPLWLKLDFEGHSIWAYNLEHLYFLRQYIEAKLRERNGQELANKSLASRLPRWMTSKKNREMILKKIDELEKK